jgi:hypothetical protein
MREGEHTPVGSFFLRHVILPLGFTWQVLPFRSLHKAFLSSGHSAIYFFILLKILEKRNLLINFLFYTINEDFLFDIVFRIHYSGVLHNQ